LKARLAYLMDTTQIGQQTAAPLDAILNWMSNPQFIALAQINAHKPAVQRAAQLLFNDLGFDINTFNSQNAPLISSSK
jgi:hypothetical protein